MTSLPKRIVVTGDVLRPNVAGDRSTQHHNIRWLQNILGHQLTMATGLPVEILAWNTAGVGDGRLTVDDVGLIYGAFGLDRSIHSWARLHKYTDPLPPRVERLFEILLKDALVVGFELPPYLKAFCNRAGLPYVDATLHPVRFLDDLLLAWSSNMPSIAEAFAANRLDEDYIYVLAGLQAASAARGFNEHIEEDCCLLVMQTWYDQSQIEDGLFVSPLRFADELAAISQQHSETLLKEHPLEPHPDTGALALHLPRLRSVEANVYSLMARPELQTVVTLSSSVGIEAKYFDKEVAFVMCNPIQNSGTGEPEVFPIRDAFLATDFWRAALKDVVSVTPPDGISIPFKPNRLRIAIKSFWNFNQIDTDIAIAARR